MPRWLFERAEDARLYSVGHAPSRCHTGLYNQFLCYDCEARLSDYDGYARKILLDSPAREGHSVAPYKYERLKLFALSVVWRAQFLPYSLGAVRLGPFAQPMRECVSTDDPGKPQEFATVLVHLSDIDLIHGKADQALEDPLICYPQRGRLHGGINCYKFELVRHRFYVVVDTQGPPSGLLEHVLSPDRPLIPRREKFLMDPDSVSTFNEIMNKSDAQRGTRPKSQ